MFSNKQWTPTGFNIFSIAESIIRAVDTNISAKSAHYSKIVNQISQIDIFRKSKIN